MTQDSTLNVQLQNIITEKPYIPTGQPDNKGTQLSDHINRNMTRMDISIL